MIDNIASNVVSPLLTPKNQPIANQSQSFADYLMDAINKVNQEQLRSEEMNKKLVTGEVRDLHEVMIVSQQASLSLQLAVQVRNKVVEAYQEIMRMPL